MSDPTGSMIQLYDGTGRVITRFHPAYEDTIREIKFSGYNPRPERRGGSGGMHQNAGTETLARNRDRLNSMWDARDAAKFTWIGGSLARIVLYACGRIHCKSDTGDPQIDEAYDSYFHDWCGDERGEDGLTLCDITGRHRFIRMVQMSLLEYLVSGDCGLIEVAPEFSPTGRFCLQAVESDRIGSPLEAVNSESYIGGITLDPNTGRIISYRIFRRTRTNQYVDQQDIEPKDFIHIVEQDRTDEYRGQTKLLRCLNDLRDLREWCDAEMIAGKTQAQWAALVGTKDPFNNTGPAAWTGKTENGTPTQNADWGKILKLSEGENFSMLSPSSRPSGAFMSFLETKIRMMAHSLKVSFGLLWNLGVLGGVSQRLEVQADLRFIQGLQRNILEDLVLNRTRSKVISEGIALGALPPTPRWKSCSWSFGPFLTADLGYEMDADIAALSHGIGDVDETISKHTGKSAAELAKANAATANKYIAAGAEAELPVEAFASGQYPMITAQKAAFNTPTPLPPPPPLSIQTLTDKGIKPLIEIMEKVGAGVIDRDSAIQAVMRIYSIPRGEAEKVIPDEPAEDDLNRAAGLTPEGEHAPVVAGPKTSSSNGSNGSKSKRK